MNAETFPISKEKMKVLIPSAGGVIERQCSMALQEAGHKVFSHKFNPYKTGNDRSSIRKLIEEKEIEIVFCFEDDPEAILLGTCEEHNIRLAIWHLDAPYQYFLPGHIQGYRDVYHFCMDRYYVDFMRKIGYQKVEYLPLGVTPHIFKPLKERREDLKAEVGFVANLSIRKAHVIWDWIINNWEGGSEDYQLIKELITLSADEGIDIPTTIQIFDKKGLDLHLILYIIKFVETIANQERRKRPPLAIRDFVDLKVVGEDWGYVGLYKHQIHPRIGYYDELPIFYNSAIINLNVSHPQVKRGLNQRFLDVPACGGFLISDWNDEIGKFFIPGEEIVIYRDTTEVHEIVRYYLDHGDEREAIAQAAREKVLAHHTMKNRIEKVIQVLKHGNL